MTDTARRKDLIYPAVNDVQTLNGAQFDSDSTPSPTHQHNGMLPQKTPITIDVATGFSSEEETGGADVIQTSQSCGQGELLNQVMKDSNDKRLTGKYIELPMSEDIAIDEGIQSTYTLFTKHGSKSLPRQKATSVCLEPASPHRSMSNHSSPIHGYLSPPSPSRNILRCSSPDIGGSRRIHSNPFFVQDRLSRSNLERHRLDSAPAKMNLRITDMNETRSQSSASIYPPNSSLSTSKSFSHTTGSSVNNGLNSVNIQSRIKLWADKEKEAKETKELERIRSPSSQKSNNSSPQRSHSNTPPKVFDLITRPKSPIKIVESPEENSKPHKKHSSVTTNSNTTSPSRSPIKGRKSRSSSKDSSSEQNSPKKSRWKLKSPLFGRKKALDSLSVDSEQSDENTLSGSNEKLDKKAHKISSRTSHKRKAVKKRLSSALGRSHSDDKVIRDDQALPTSKPPIPDRQRSSSVGPKQSIRLNHRRATSQPNIHKNTVQTPEIEGDYMIVRSKRLDAETEIIIGSSSSSSLSNDVVLRDEKGRKNADAKTKTISRDIRDIIDSLGTSNLDHGDSQGTLSLVNEKVMSPELQSGVELSPPESQLDVVIQRPAVASGPSLFSDDEEPFIPRGRCLMYNLM